MSAPKEFRDEMKYSMAMAKMHSGLFNMIVGGKTQLEKEENEHVCTPACKKGSWVECPRFNDISE